MEIFINWSTPLHAPERVLPLQVIFRSFAPLCTPEYLLVLLSRPLSKISEAEHVTALLDLYTYHCSFLLVFRLPLLLLLDRLLRPKLQRRNLRTLLQRLTRNLQRSHRKRRSNQLSHLGRQRRLLRRTRLESWVKLLDYRSSFIMFELIFLNDNIITSYCILYFNFEFESSYLQLWQYT